MFGVIDGRTPRLPSSIGMLAGVPLLLTAADRIVPLCDLRMIRHSILGSVDHPNALPDGVLLFLPFAGAL